VTWNGETGEVDEMHKAQLSYIKCLKQDTKTT